MKQVSRKLSLNAAWKRLEIVLGPSEEARNGHLAWEGLHFLTLCDFVLASLSALEAIAEPLQATSGALIWKCLGGPKIAPLTHQTHVFIFQEKTDLSRKNKRSEHDIFQSIRLGEDF